MLVPLFEVELSGKTARLGVCQDPDASRILVHK